MTFPNSFFPAHVIASVLKVTHKTVHSRARRENWPSRPHGNRVEYAPPRPLLHLCQELEPVPSILYQQTRIRELRRAATVLGYVLEMQRNPQRGVERALLATVKKFRHLMPFSVTALRRWVAGVEQKGLLALQERKLGCVGRKAFRLEKMLR